MHSPIFKKHKQICYLGALRPLPNLAESGQWLKNELLGGMHRPTYYQQCGLLSATPIINHAKQRKSKILLGLCDIWWDEESPDGGRCDTRDDSDERAEVR